MCKGKGTTEIFNTGIAELSIWLGKTTSRDMENAVIRLIENHRNERQEQDWTEWNGAEEIKEALLEQEQISAEAFLSGIVKHRNEALHKRDNVVRQKDHDKLNDKIQNCMRQLPRSLRVFTPAEQRFFRRTKITQLPSFQEWFHHDGQKYNVDIMTG